MGAAGFRVLSMALTIFSVGAISRFHFDRALDYECVPCEYLFSRLEPLSNGGRFQEIAMQERGQPKTGTGFMFSWADAALELVCDYLSVLFGELSCRVELTGPEEDPSCEKTIIFAPHLGKENARCPCENVQRVSASISRRQKHHLPINDDCPWRRGVQFEHGNFTTGSRPITSYEDLWTFVHRANCTPTDNRLQMALLRDPRPTVVSTYFHKKRFGHVELVDGQTLDEYVVSNAVRIAQAIALRYILFGTLMKNTSALFWYETTHSSPVEWHEDWFAFMGFDLPPSIIQTAANNAVSRRVNLNGHPGGEESVVGRSFKDEVRPDVADELDKLVRKWLPQIMLERFEIPF